MRAHVEMALALIGYSAIALCGGGCDNWPVQKDAGSGGSTLDPSRRAVSSDCVTFDGAVPSSSAQVNGSLCFGIALGSSEALQCASSETSGIIDCFDALLGTGYSARWNGESATVHGGFGQPQIGAISRQAASTYEILADQVEGRCELTVNPPRAQFCLYE